MRITGNSEHLGGVGWGAVHCRHNSEDWDECSPLEILLISDYYFVLCDEERRASVSMFMSYKNCLRK